MIKAIIIDDEEIGRELLVVLILKHCKNVTIVDKVSNINDGYESIILNKPDVVFLDIEMPDGDGFKLLEKFNKIKFSVIFVTAYNQHAIKAIKFSAIDYLLKPINEDELITAVKKVEDLKLTQNSLPVDELMQENLKSNIGKLALRTYSGLVFVDINDIIKCEANKTKTWCYLKDKTKILAVKSLGELEVILNDFNFIRVHHSYIINLNYIKSYSFGRTGIITMTDDSLVCVSQRKKGLFLKQFNEV